MDSDLRNFTIAAYLIYEKRTGTEHVICKGCALGCDEPIQGIMFETTSISNQTKSLTCKICGSRLSVSCENQI